MQSPVLLLDVSTVTPQGLELHLDLSLLQACAVTKLVYNKGPELHPDLVRQQ
jgi:hypothetical protein